MVRQIADDDRFAEEYTERREAITFDDLHYARFSGLAVDHDARRESHNQTALEFEYATRSGRTKSVRCYQGTEVNEFEVERGIPDGTVTFFEDGDKFAVDVDDGILYSVGGDRVTTLSDDVTPVRIDLPEPAPVTGAVQEDVDVTVFYRSKRSGNMKEMHLTDVRVDWDGDRVTGTDTRRDRRVEVTACYNRSVVSKGRREEEIGKTARIEYPVGHRYTVDVEGVVDEDADHVRKTIEDALSKTFGRFSDDEREATVTHEGRID